ncbi:MAG: hypothetical protein WCQ48_00970 [Chloroflexota bacterium]
MRVNLALIALILMWLASINQEPGGLPAFAAEMVSVEQEVSAATLHADGAFRELDREFDTVTPAGKAHVTEYPDGVFCEHPAADATASPNGSPSKEQCVSLVGVDADNWP